MEQAARTQIRLILDHASEESRRQFDKRLQEIYAHQTSAGRLQSGATITAVLGAMEELASEFIRASVDQVALVAKDTEAFAMLNEALGGYLAFLKKQSTGVADLAAGKSRGGGDSNSVHKVAERLFSDMQGGLTRQLELHRFSFTVPSGRSVSRPEPASLPKPRKGGRPPAEFWDDMWAAMAVALYNGDLEPKSQAGIERAMADWIEEHGHSASTSTVRARARRLWDLLQTSD